MKHTDTTAPITIRKSSTEAFPFRKQSYYEQDYAGRHEDQAVAYGIGPIGAQNYIQGR